MYNRIERRTSMKGLSKEESYYIITPSKRKMKILEELEQEDEFYSVTFDSLESLKEKYFFHIKDEAILSLLEQGESLEVAKEILKLLYPISLDQTYFSSKLKKIQYYKKELEEKGYLEYDLSFRDFLKTKKVIVDGYLLLEPYEEKMLKDLHAIFWEEEPSYPFQEVYHYGTMRAEVVGVADRIRQLNKKGVSYRHILLAGVDSSYFYLLEEIFSQYDIPFFYPFEDNFLTTKMGKKYFRERNLEEMKNEEVRHQLLVIEEKLDFAKNSPYYDLLLQDELKKVTLVKQEYYDMVTVVDEALTTPFVLGEDDYLFILGWNQNKLPHLKKDEDYLSDREKKEVDFLTSDLWNKKKKEEFLQACGSIPHKVISYKDTSLQETFYPSSMIEEENILVKEAEKHSFFYSDSYNQFTYASLLDQYYTYHEENPLLLELQDYYSVSFYRSYDHLYHSVITKKEPLVLSYSHLSDYALCPFRYYAKYVLHLEEYMPSFAQKLGNIFHYVLSKMYQESFDFEKSYQYILKEENLTLKERFFMRRLKEELLFLVETIKEQEQTTGLTSQFLEKKIEIPLRDQVTIKGFLDKILYRKIGDKTYYAIIDYKTGQIHLQLDYLKDGLYMQLPCYLYLVEKSGIFDQPVFAGFYYQKLLSSSKTLEEKKKDLRLFGVSAEEEDTLAILDENYSKSDWIKGLSVTKQNTISSRAKVMTEEQKEVMVSLVEKKILEFSKAIEEGAFPIQPKIVERKNVSCEYCSFASFCFHDEKDNRYVEKEEKEV